jgi:hypothetical protein
MPEPDVSSAVATGNSVVTLIPDEADGVTQYVDGLVSVAAAMFFDREVSMVPFRLMNP